MNYGALLGLTFVASLMVAAEQAITENCIPYREYCVTSDLPCCWKRETENGLIRHWKTTCDFMLRTCNVFSDIYKFNETSDFINRNIHNEDLDALYDKWLEYLSEAPVGELD